MKLTPMKAIRKKCLDCSAGSPKEVRLCPVADCFLYTYRFGHRPKNTEVNKGLDTIEEKIEEKS